MTEIIIDGSKFTTPDKFHDEIEKISSIIDYGRNLDALYDVLAEMSNTVIVIKNIEMMKKNLGSYTDKILAVMNDANVDNEHLSVKFSS